MTTTASRDTTTGFNYENYIGTLLESTTWQFKRQVNIGKKRNGGKHYIDYLLYPNTLLSLKYQCVQGTAEEKVPFEIMKLHHACVDCGYDKAILVLAGPDKAWKWKQYYLSEQFRTDMKVIYPTVTILSHQQFVLEQIPVDSQGSVTGLLL